MQGHPLAARWLSSHPAVPLATCVIVRGELMFMAENSERKHVNLVRVREFLRDIETHVLDDETADVYGRLKAALLNRLGPRKRAKRRRVKIETLGFKDNDLWIAAAAMRHGLTLISGDRDFERIARVEGLSHEGWRSSTRG